MAMTLIALVSAMKRNVAGNRNLLKMDHRNQCRRWENDDAQI